MKKKKILMNLNIRGNYRNTGQKKFSVYEVREFANNNSVCCWSHFQEPHMSPCGFKGSMQHSLKTYANPSPFFQKCLHSTHLADEGFDKTSQSRTRWISQEPPAVLHQLIQRTVPVCFPMAPESSSWSSPQCKQGEVAVILCYPFPYIKVTNSLYWVGSMINGNLRMLRIYKTNLICSELFIKFLPP